MMRPGRFTAPRHGLTLHAEIIFVIVAFGLFPTIFLGIFSYGKMTGLLEERLLTYSAEMARQAADSLSGLLGQAEAARTQVILKANASEPLLSRAATAPIDENPDAREMREFLQNLRLSRPMLYNLHIISGHGDVYSSSIIIEPDKLLSKSWVQDLLNPAKPRESLHLHRADYQWPGGTAPYVLSLATRISWRKHPDEIVRIVLDISSDSLTSALRAVNIERSGELLLVDEQGKVLASGRPEHIASDIRELFGPCVFEPRMFQESSTRNCNGKIVVQRSLDPLGYVIGVVPLADFLDDFTRVRNLFVLLSLGFAAITVGLSIAVAGRITVPIRRLAGAMGRIQTGDFSARVEERGTREMIMLARSFNAMGAEIDELMGRIALKERETLRAELLALRLQINPHFLYNTLDVMRGMALAGGATEAAEIARSLAALLRYSTVKDSDHVQVRDELGSLRHYLKIQKHRFGSRFTMRIRVEPDVAASLVPRFILQPLVENAFLHAVERSLMRLALLVSIHAEADDLLVEVIDNGAGMGEQELSAIQGSLLQGMESANTGIGLQNVHNRIRLAYGPGYGVSIESSQGRGTRVVVRLPRKIRPNGSI